MRAGRLGSCDRVIKGFAARQSHADRRMFCHDGLASGVTGFDTPTRVGYTGNEPLLAATMSRRSRFAL